jgi:amino-acid N-acetyltransferase
VKADIKVDRARVGDAHSMHRLISCFADKGEVLPRALSEIYDGIRDYFAVRKRGRVIACAALHVTWVDLAEGAEPKGWVGASPGLPGRGQ